jgi:xylan 1,4-beta-xylosidase
MGMAAQLRTIEEGFRIVAAYPELKHLPIVIGESDPEGCAACQGPQLAYRNGTMYSSYTAASFARKLELAERHGVNLEGALTWAFEFEDQPYFAGFRSLASHGIDKPVLNVFRMFSRMSGQRLSVSSDNAVSLDDITRAGVRAGPDVTALATLEARRLCVLLWHYHDDDVAGPDASVSLEVKGLEAGRREVKRVQYQIDAEHSNAFALWKRLGSPAEPSAAQRAQLEQAGNLARFGTDERAEATAGQLRVNVRLPRQAVSLLEFTW